MNKKQRAFTLVELLVMISIISLLASTLYSNFSDARTIAKERAVATSAQSLQTNYAITETFTISAANQADSTNGASGIYVQNGQNNAGFQEIMNNLNSENLPHDPSYPYEVVVLDYDKNGTVDINSGDELTIVTPIKESGNETQLYYSSEGYTLSTYLLTLLEEGNIHRGLLQYCFIISDADNTDPGTDMTYEFTLYDNASAQLYRLTEFGPFSGDGTGYYVQFWYKGEAVYSWSGYYNNTAFTNNKVIFNGDASFLYKAIQAGVFPVNEIEEDQSSCDIPLRKNLFTK
jgi:prepilin-type N-terminal cleavage/methylation domain-containing protein